MNSPRFLNPTRLWFAAFAWALPAAAHDGSSAAKSAEVFPVLQLAQLGDPQKAPAQGGGKLTLINKPASAAAFAAFEPRVKVRWNERHLFVESDGLPSHNMMVGITAWQQQVPLPQSYAGANAWQIPLVPVPSKTPVSIKGRFLRGAIAIAANGVPIFNPQNNRGEIAAEIGELDQWGGHCGRADDYHYHVAPLHLQSVVGLKLPIAYALDGYPIYGLTEPDGSVPAGLDAFHGHADAALGYHYHASKQYPYVNGGFHGEVVEVGEQVDPQPRARSVREAGQPLRGAKITDFQRNGSASFKLTYEVNGERRAIVYAANPDGTYPFEFQNGAQGTVKAVYTQSGGGGPRPEGEKRGPGGRKPEAREAGGPKPPSGPGGRDPKEPRRDAPPDGGPRKPWIQVHGAEVDANHDGTIAWEEFLAEAKRSFDGYDRNRDGQLTREEYQGPGVRSPMGGFVKEHAAQIDANSDGILTWEEFLAHVKPMFEKQDRNRDGKLTPEEWRDLPEVPREAPSPARNSGGAVPTRP